MAIDERFYEYFAALDRSGNRDHCYLCRRTPAEVKRFFGFDENGVPIHAQHFGLEDIVLEQTDIMSYRGVRPVCAICQLNFDAIFVLGEDPIVDELVAEMQAKRDYLWPGRDEK
jgi:hypothetical protein